MPLDYSFHELGTAVMGQLPPAPHLPVLGGQVALAENTDSAAIVAAGPVALMLVATAKLRLDVQLTGTALDPANSPVVLLAGERAVFALRRGSYKLRTTLYV